MALFEIKNLSFTYPNQTTAALADINLSIEQGDFVAVCGKSGCGKSTLIRHFKGDMTPYGTRTGEILYMGKPLEQVNLRTQAADIGYVTQNPDNQIVTDKVWHEMAFGLENLGMDLPTMRLRVAEMSSYFGIQNWFDKAVKELSGGQKQILNLASVMAMHPRMLVLDEPTSQLDPIAASDFLHTIKKLNTDLGITVLIVEHRLEEVFPLADKILVMEEGRILAYDTPQNIGRNLAYNDLFVSFPAPVQAYAALEKEKERWQCPLTIRDGRKWLDSYAERNAVASQPVPTPQPTPPKKKEPEELAVKAEEIWFRYERNGADIVKGLSLQVKKGELYCILGGNGSGKSTTLKLLAAMHHPYRGKIEIAGKNINKYKGNSLFDGVLALLPQDPQCLFVSDTVLGDLRELLSPMKLSKEEQEQRLEKVIQETEIRHLLPFHPYDLSCGEQQRVALAKILLLEPAIVMLDEPTKGLDGFYKKKLAAVFQKMRENGRTILMVSHDVEFCAAYADTCGMFFDGKTIAQQKAKEFFTGNNFYTSAVNKMARHRFPDAVTLEDLVAVCKTM